ncbi:MAG: hypothetical protein IIX36_03580 [Clostridia bacterium]|nr:hypothetical protein [Clostridia bacterium]
MKKVLCGILIALIVLVAAVAAYITVDNRTLKNTLSYFTEIEIFAPSGMADEYESLLSMTFDDHRIWKYKLKRKEAEKMAEEIKNSHWHEFSDYEKAEAEFYLPDTKWYDDFSDEVYYCLYDTVNEEFVSFGEWAMPRFFFAYDAANREYYCVTVTI